jgi:GNAT superfamily N-acetyltransferase
MSIDYAVERIMAEINAETPDEHWIQSLDDGTQVLIRPLHAEDRYREFAFINALSSTSRRFWLLATVREVDNTLLSQMMDIDYRSRMAYLALVHQHGVLKEIGVSRYAAIDGGQRCEYAVVVADKWQRRGLGLLLMEHLIKAARRNHFEAMASLDLTDNHAMQHLAKKLGFARFQKATDFSEVIHELDLRP